MRFILLFLITLPLQATNYYIAAGGSDSNAGTSTGSPWQHISKVNSFTFAAGDTINFNGGDTFSGTISKTLVGTSLAGYTITSYGSGRAIISSSTSDGIVLTDSEYVTITNINLAGAAFVPTFPAPVTDTDYGIHFLSTRMSGNRFRNDIVTHCDVTGYWWGITYDARTSGTDGYDGANASYNTGSNWASLIFTQGYGAEAGGAVNIMTNHYFGYNSIQYGAGMVLGSTTGLTVEYNYIHHDLEQPHSGLGGSSSIAITNSRNFTCNHNEVTLTKGTIHTDSSAIDLDQDVQNGEVAFNLTYNNIGPSVQFGSFGGKTTGSFTIHHNISYNDVRGDNLLGTSEQGAIRIWGNTNAVDIFNNTIFVDYAGSIGIPSAVNFEAGNNLNIQIVNNILKTTGNIYMFWANEGSAPTHLGTPTVVGNIYDSSGASLFISNDNGTTYVDVTTLAAWRALGFEVHSAVNYGSTAGAYLSNLGSFSPPLGGFTANGGIAAVNNFNIVAASSAVAEGIDPSLLSITLGAVDYHGNPSHRGAAFDAGAITYIAAQSPSIRSIGNTIIKGATVIH